LSKKLSGIKAHTTYKLANGQKVPGATTVLGVMAKPQLIPWANKLGLEGIEAGKYVDKLANIGTLAHYMIECYIKSEQPDLSPFSKEEIDLAENSVLSFYEWEKQYDFYPIKSELQLVSEQYRFGGTVDCYAQINGKFTLLDFKTSKAIYEEHIVQLAAYKQLLEENGYQVDEVRILRIGRTEDEGFEERREVNLTNHFELFKHLIKVYEFKNLIKKEAV
jgi:hypothetical protein